MRPKVQQKLALPARSHHRRLLAGKASSRQARAMRGIIITMRGGDITTNNYDIAGKNTCRVMSNIHIMRGSVHAGRKHAGRWHAGRHHRTEGSHMTKNKASVELCYKRLLHIHFLKVTTIFIKVVR